MAPPCPCPPAPPLPLPAPAARLQQAAAQGRRPDAKRNRILATTTSVWSDDVWAVDSTPVECGRSRETVKRSDLAGWAEYGYCASHSRFFWGLRNSGSSAELKGSGVELKALHVLGAELPLGFAKSQRPVQVPWAMSRPVPASSA